MQGFQPPKESQQAWLTVSRSCMPWGPLSGVPSTPGSVGWKGKAAQSPPQTGSSLGRSSPPEAFAEEGRPSPLNPGECGGKCPACGEIPRIATTGRAADEVGVAGLKRHSRKGAPCDLALTGRHPCRMFGSILTFTGRFVFTARYRTRHFTRTTMLAGLRHTGLPYLTWTGCFKNHNARAEHWYSSQHLEVLSPARLRHGEIKPPQCAGSYTVVVSSASLDALALAFMWAALR